jgi:pectinesterase
MKTKVSIALFCCILILPFSGFARQGEAKQAELQYNAVVDGNYNGSDSALIHKIKTYKTVQSALQDAPANLTHPYVIYIKNGRYYEKLTIDKPFITLLGESRDRTVVTYDACADTLDPTGAKYGTFGSASVAVLADHFKAENLTIENGWDYNANMAKDDNDSTKAKNPQAVALKTANGSDKVIFRNVKLIGFQDTLYLNSGATYFVKCYISGNIDFIFGAGQAVFNDCDIISRDRGMLDTKGGDSALPGKTNGFLTAPSTKGTDKYGFLFLNSRLKKESPTMADDSVTLGRPWHPTTDLPDGTRAADPRVNSAVAYIHCYMDAHIAAKGWDPMAGKDANGNKIWFYPEDSRFFEYGSTGPGAKTSPTRKLLDEAAAKEFSIVNVLGGWNPEQ